MKNLWLTFFTGRVLVKVEGRGFERLINHVTRTKLALWNVKQHKKEGITFFISLQDIHKLRKIARQYDCKISFIRGEGFPFLLKRAGKNGGFIVGIGLFFLVGMILSNITWGIEVKGANPETEHKIRLELDKLGIKIGSLHWLNDHPETIQKKLTDRLENITWIGVELKGTTFHFQVVEKNEPDKVEESGPRELVAKKKSVIANLFIEKGKPLVKVNQYVDKGQLLVSGVIGEGENQRLIAATGKVWGKTWYKTDVKYPLESNLLVYNGEELRVQYIRVGKLNIRFWGFKKNDFSQYETELDDHPIYLLGWKLPLSYIEKTIREKEEIQRSLTKQEAVEAAKELARMDLKMKIPEDAKVDKEYILHEEVENGKVVLSVYFQVIENIAEEKPIIQGD